MFATDERYAIVKKIAAYGDEIGWLAAQPYVSGIIADVTKPGQIRQNVAAAGWQPTTEQLEAIGNIADG